MKIERRTTRHNLIEYLKRHLPEHGLGIQTINTDYSTIYRITLGHWPFREVIGSIGPTQRMIYFYEDSWAEILRSVLEFWEEKSGEEITVIIFEGDI